MTKDLDLSLIGKNSSFDELTVIMDGVNNRRTIKIEGDNKEPIILQEKEIANLNLLFFLKAVDGKCSSFRISDYFQIEYNLTHVDANDNKYIIPIFWNLRPEHYNSLDNIDFSSLVGAYKKLLAHNTKIFKFANQNLLNLLWAFDESHQNVILETAFSLAEWILNEDIHSTVSHSIKILNYLQVVKRLRELNLDEKKQMVALRDEKQTDKMSKVAISLLLDDHVSAEIYFSELEPDEQDAFKGFPIYKFWQQ